ncbi:MAG: hypothetical protein ACPGWS_08040, partial [Solirubrobacterales bacterium]
MRSLVWLLLIASVLVADDSEKADKLKGKGKALAEGGTSMWARFIENPTAVSDDDLRALADNYDAAIENYHLASELREDNHTNSAILNLAKRAAQLRATLWAREMAVKAKEAEARKRAAKEAGETAGPGREAKPKPPRKTTTPQKAKPKNVPPAVVVPAPTISETKKERAANIRRIRRFVFDHFRHMKPGIIRYKCGLCGGDAKRRVREGVPPNTRYFWRACPRCVGKG